MTFNGQISAKFKQLKVIQKKHLGFTSLTVVLVREDKSVEPLEILASVR